MSPADRTAAALAAAGFVQEPDHPYFRRWMRDQRAYAVCMSRDEGAPLANDWALYVSVCDGMEEFYTLTSHDDDGRGLSIEAVLQRVVTLDTDSKLPDALFAPVLTIDEAKDWIRALADAGLMFHFDDDTRDLLAIPADRSTPVANWQRFFTPLEAALCDHQRNMLYAFPDGAWGADECPIGFALTLPGVAA